MAAITIKCPNCGGELIFDPASQRYKCAYCSSDFSQRELEEMNPAEGAEHVEAEEEPEQSGASSAVIYTCPSCGAQIVTEETTAATFCYYCHNPVVLSGRLSGDYLPDKIIPFAIDRERAVQRFTDYMRSKKFVPRAFWDENQIEKLTGVYYPYWVYDCELDGELDGEATMVRVWRMGDTEYTETSFFRVEREGRISLKNMSKNALAKSDKSLVEGVMPFQLDVARDFSIGYLSGFLAEKRDLEKTEFESGFRKQAAEYSERILRDTISGFATVNIHNRVMRPAREDWKYMLLPVWVLTYPGSDGHVFYYAMNGQNGNICGKLPIDYRKLVLWSALIAMMVFIICMAGGYIL